MINDPSKKNGFRNHVRKPFFYSYEKNTPKGSRIPNPAASVVLPLSGLLDSNSVFLFHGTMYQEQSFLPSAFSEIGRGEGFRSNFQFLYIVEKWPFCIIRFSLNPVI
jgi:hypothetical protein